MLAMMVASAVFAAGVWECRCGERRNMRGGDAANK